MLTEALQWLGGRRWANESGSARRKTRRTHASMPCQQSSGMDTMPWREAMLFRKPCRMGYHAARDSQPCRVGYPPCGLGYSLMPLGATGRVLTSGSGQWIGRAQEVERRPVQHENLRVVDRAHLYVQACDAQRNTCNRQGATCNVQRNACDAQRNACDAQRNACDRQGATCNVTHATCKREPCSKHRQLPARSNTTHRNGRKQRRPGRQFAGFPSSRGTLANSQDALVPRSGYRRAFLYKAYDRTARGAGGAPVP